MSLSARSRRRRRRRSVLVLAPLLVITPAAVAFAILDQWRPTLPWTATPVPGADPTSPGTSPEVPSTEPPPTLASQSPSPGTGTAGRHDREGEAEPSHRGYDIDSASSLTVVVNKRRALDPVDYTPDRLTAVGGSAVTMRPDAAEALGEMRTAAQRDGRPFAVHSATRTYDEQARTFEGWVTELGVAEAERASARPGHSEHQTGLALDVVALGEACGAMTCFGETKASQWLVEHAHRYGYIVRFGAEHESWTGYQAEPWHLRFVGREVAEEIREAGDPSLEEFFGLEPATSYVD